MTGMTLMGEIVTTKARGSISPTTKLTDSVPATHLQTIRLCSRRRRMVVSPATDPLARRNQL